MEAVVTRVGVYDVFCSHHGADIALVERLATRLRQAGLEPWLDKWHLTPGEPWQPALSKALRASRACAVFVSEHGLGDWANEELALAQDRAAHDRDFRLFAVWLPGADPESSELDFVRMRTWVDLRSGVSDADGFQDLVCAVTGVPRRRPEPPVGDEDQCPYRGLEAFDEDHAEFFFGREDDTARMLERLRDGRFLAVLGPSGSGKSSLLRAGLVHALERGALRNSDAWPIRTMAPGARPLSALAAALADLGAAKAMGKTLDALAADERTVDLAAVMALGDGHVKSDRVVLVVDQLEEAFTLCRNEDERRAFFGNLAYAATIPGGRTVVLLGLRADFYSHAAPYPQLAALLARHQYLVSPLSPDGLRRVIEEPAWHANLRIEPGLTDTILADVEGAPGVLPLLEHVLLEVWRRRRNRMLTLEAYRRAGGVDGALAKRANTTYEALSPERRALARRVLLRLVQPGEGSLDTRRRATLSELVTSPREQRDVTAVVDALADERLLSTGTDESTGAPVVEVTHEALIRAWPELRGWVHDEREHLLAMRRLADAARDWDASERDPALLYRGARLAAWAEAPRDDLNERERAFLTASTDREEAEVKARRRRIQMAVGGLTLALIVISALGLLAMRQRDQARSRALASSAAEQLAFDPQLSLLLAREAYAASPTREAREALRVAAHNSREVASLPTGVRPRDAAFSPDARTVAAALDDGRILLWRWRSKRRATTVLEGHHGTVADVAFSPDGRRLISGGRDGTVRLWDLRRPRARAQTLSGQIGRVASVAFSPIERAVAAGSADGVVRVWDTAKDDPLFTLPGHTDAVRRLAFSPDGLRLVTAGKDGDIRVWDLRRTGTSKVLKDPSRSVFSAAFDPRSRRVVTGSGDGAVRVWDPGAGAPPFEIRRHLGPVYQVSFSPNGQEILSASNDSEALVSNLACRCLSSFLDGHRAAVYAAGFSRDGQHVVTAGADGTVRVWDVGARRAPLLRDGRHGPIEAATLTPDGRWLLSAGGHGRLALLPVGDGRSSAVFPHGGTAVFAAALSRDGRRVVTAGGDRSIVVTDLVPGPGSAALRFGHSLMLPGARVHIDDLAFSRDGRRIAGAGADGKLRVWDAAGRADPLELSGHTGRVWGVAFSPDGRRLASAGEDATVRIWDLARPGRAIVRHGHRGSVNAVAFSPDGTRVASGGEDQTVRVWKWASASRAQILPGDNAIVTVAFSPGGGLLTAGTATGGVRIWDWSRGERLMAIRAHSGSTRSVQLTPDGRVVSAGTDGTVRVDACDVCGPIEDVVDLARRRATRDLTAEERDRFQVPG